MNDFIKLFLLWLGIPIVGALISYILGCLTTYNKKNKEEGVKI